MCMYHSSQCMACAVWDVHWMFKDNQDAKLEWSVKFNNKGILYSHNSDTVM